MSETIGVEMSEAPLWIFGYGSLVWRPAFPHAERHPGYVSGYYRRFWQGSTDHRGVPGAPGRVVTLLPAPSHERCWGMVYRVEPGHEAQVLAGLDHREKGGYERRRVSVTRSQAQAIDALVYLATPENPEWLGEAPLVEIAAQIRQARGPSGANIDYLLRLREALDEFGGQDPHVESLCELL